MVPTPSAASYWIASYFSLIGAGGTRPARFVGGLFQKRAGSVSLSPHDPPCAELGDGGGVVACLAEDDVGVLAEQRRRPGIARGRAREDERLAHHAQAADLGMIVLAHHLVMAHGGVV